MTPSEVIEWIKKISSQYQASPGKVKVTKQSAREIIKDLSFSIWKAWTSDSGRENVVNEVNHFVHFMKMIFLCLEKIHSNPQLIWNIDEVGIQLVE